MKKRSLAGAIEDLCFADHKIALVSGPRQCGKTTMARAMLRGRRVGRYANWDDIAFRRQWARDPSAVVPATAGGAVPLVVLDEVHKHRKWKRHLKGVYDSLERPCDILVTGSARLDVYRRGSDSLLGRHFAFRLHPFTIAELRRPEPISPDEALDRLFAGPPRRSAERTEALEAMLRFGPFPEPFLAQSDRKARMWRRSREQLVVREDLRDLSRLPELDRIEMLTAMLPERVGSLYSVPALAEDLEAGNQTVQRWLRYLAQLYYLFEVKPYSRRIPRSLKKGGKIYLWDYGGIEDAAARLENLVACHLLAACHTWTDTGHGAFDLTYVRNKEKQEIDFLVVRDGVPWLPVEVKLNDVEPSPNWRKFAPLLPCTRGLQVVRRPTWSVHEYGPSRVLVAGAAEALSCLV